MDVEHPHGALCPNRIHVTTFLDVGRPKYICGCPPPGHCRYHGSGGCCCTGDHDWVECDGSCLDEECRVLECVRCGDSMEPAE